MDHLIHTVISAVGVSVAADGSAEGVDSDIDAASIGSRSGIIVIARCAGSSGAHRHGYLLVSESSGSECADEQSDLGRAEHFGVVAGRV